MRRFHPLLSTTLVLLLLVLSFNAYACLLPVSSISNTEMGNGCSTPEEQPARQVCDAFKTFHVEASGQGQPTFDSQILWFGETVLGVLLSLPPTNGILKYPLPSDSSSQLLRTSTTVLRI
jgi:hypothetical protein